MSPRAEVVVTITCLCFHVWTFSFDFSGASMFPMSSASSWRLLARHQQRCCPARVHLRALQTTTATRTRNFKEDVKERKHAARRYVVLENCNPRKDINNLLSKHRIDGSYLSSQLNVEVTDHWTWFFRRRNFLLLELANRNEVQRLQAQAGYQSHSFPVQTRMLRANIDLPETALVEREDVNDHRHQQMLTSELRLAFDCGEIRKQVPSKQFATYLEENNCLTELDLRLRYFLLTELEDQLCGGVFDGFQIYPFGSSLAGLGDGSSDLDLVMLHRSLRQQGPLTFAHPEVRSERDQTQLALSMLADAFKNFIPNFSSINRILRARVPIVKAGFELAPIDLDISIELSEEGAHHGFIMANYIAYAINADPMVRQLFAFLKLWARQHGLVRSIAGNWFSNFQIITLAMYFLQTKNILKPFETYQNSEKNVEAKSKLKFEQLIYDFFEFVVSFNFEKDGISIYQGGTISKPDFAPIYLENPIERELNIFKNVNGVEFKKFLLMSYNTLDAMHTKGDYHLVDLLDPAHFKKLEAKDAKKQKQK